MTDSIDTITVKRAKCFDELRGEHATPDYTPLTMHGRLRLELRSARFAWINARYMLALANRGKLDKGQAFTVFNKARAEYQRTIKLVAAVLALPRNIGTGTVIS